MSQGCCTSCGEITLFGGKDGATIHSGTGAPNVGNPNNGDYYIDTSTWEIYGPYDGSWGTGTSLIGPQGPAGPTGNGIASIAWTSNSAGGAQGDPGTTDTYTVTYTDATTDTFLIYNGANGINANSTYGNTLFVDNSFGNNTTGTRERFDLPYATVTEALANAVSGDTIIVRAGVYSGNIVLKDGVDLYFEQNTFLNGQITDNDVSVTCVIDGYLKLSNTNNAIILTGSNTDVNCTLDYIVGANTPILVRPLEVGTPEAYAVFNLNKVTGLSSNYFATVYGNAYVTINVKEKVTTLATTSNTVGFVAFFIENNFRGRVNVKCPYVYIGNSTHDGGGILLLEGSLNVNPSNIFMDIDKFECDYDYASPGDSGIIEKAGASRAIINIKEFKSKVRTPIKVGKKPLAEPGTENGSLIFNGNIYSESYPCVHYRSEQKTVLSGVFKRGAGGLNEAVTIMAGVNANYGVIEGIDTGWKLYLKEATVVKEGGGADIIISKNGSATATPIYIVDCKIDNKGTGTMVAIDGSSTTDDDFYVRNTIGNVDNTAAANFVNSASGGTLYLYDANFKQFEDQ